MSITEFPSLLMQKLRLSKPWRYKAPCLISVPYAVLVMAEIDVWAALLALGMSCCTILGIAGVGYFLNDYTDREEDRLAGKLNVTATLAAWQLLLLLAFLLALAILPWALYFPMDRLSAWLLAGEFGLFVLYSAPPFRLKERGAPGLLADAGYAHVVPALLAAHTFALLGGLEAQAIWPYLSALGLWQGFVGLRNILLHQVGDFEKDRGTGTRTFATQVGLQATQAALQVVIALEILGAATYLVLGAPWAWFLPLVYAAFALQVVYFRVLAWKIGLPQDMTARLTTWLDDFYCGWLPLAYLGILLVRAPWMCLALGAHMLLFPNGLVQFARHFWGVWKWKIIRPA